MKKQKKAVITVCTYQRPNQLREAIKAVQRLQVPKDLTVRFHVVDNDPNEKTHTVFIEETKFLSLESYYIEERNRGLVYARNRALLEASKEDCDLIAFFDDDDKPDQDWLLNLWDCMKRHSANVVSGKMIFNWPESVELSDEVKRIYDGALDHIQSGDVMTTCGSGNTLIDLSFIQEHQLNFNKTFNLTGGEDSHFFELMTHLGASIIRCNEAIVYSDIIEDRTTEKYIWSRRYNIGYVGHLKNVLILGKRKANAKFRKKILKNYWKLFLTLFTSSPDLKIKRKQRIVEMKGMIDAFRGVKHQGYESSDGY